MSMTSADLRSLLTLVYKLVFLSVGLYMDLSGRLGGKRQRSTVLTLIYW